ncbi:uncharacterized protein [Elaeis guineensis]|uniref:Uncharacterized protein LOC105034334 n=1 Tax=Elaeis guineensis var. tenera TaxID=51953 RepID=A0A6I9QEE7_ELAGV|nr:uncharacterized protein LOC105034334 [Elaeis guineensis]
MGSLMSGWDSPFLDPDTVRLERNRSLTKEEIEIFWKLHKKTEEEEGENFQNDSHSPKQSQEMDAIRLKKFALRHQLEKGEKPGDNPDELDTKPDKSGDWWTRSNWAFLNEPPRDEMDDSAQKYTAQFHVAALATKGE